MKTITSCKNERVKAWSALKQKKYREETGLFLLEGARLVKEALQSGAAVQTMLVQLDQAAEAPLAEVIHLAEASGVEWIGVSEAVLRHVADTQSPQGVVAVARQSQWDLEAVVQNPEQALYLVLDRIQDPGNMGTMIRTADAVGVNAVFFRQGSVDLYNPKVVRSTMGSLFHLPVIECDLYRLFSRLKKEGVSLIGTSAQAEKTVFAVDLRKSVAMVVGSEAHGLSPEVQAWLDGEVRLPMPGRAESLNAAVAAAVVLYEALRQRDFS